MPCTSLSAELAPRINCIEITAPLGETGSVFATQTVIRQTKRQDILYDQNKPFLVLQEVCPHLNLYNVHKPDCFKVSILISLHISILPDDLLPPQDISYQHSVLISMGSQRPVAK